MAHSDLVHSLHLDMPQKRDTAHAGRCQFRTLLEEIEIRRRQKSATKTSIKADGPSKPTAKATGIDARSDVMVKAKIDATTPLGSSAKVRSIVVEARSPPQVSRGVAALHLDMPQNHSHKLQACSAENEQLGNEFAFSKDKIGATIPLINAISSWPLDRRFAQAMLKRAESRSTKENVPGTTVLISVATQGACSNAVNILPAGTKVRVVDFLVADLNGRSGSIRGFDGASQRYEVDVFNITSSVSPAPCEGMRVLMKAENLQEICDDTSVTQVSDLSALRREHEQLLAHLRDVESKLCAVEQRERSS